MTPRMKGHGLLPASSTQGLPPPCQVCAETLLHPELCFLYWLHDYPVLYPNQHLQITWFISWSPCCDCAEKVAAFLASHSNVSLTIYAARLYYFSRHEYQEGLRALWREGARVRIMDLRGEEQRVRVEPGRGPSQAWSPKQWEGTAGAAWGRGAGCWALTAPHPSSQSLSTVGRTLCTPTTDGHSGLGRTCLKTTASRSGS